MILTRYNQIGLAMGSFMMMFAFGTVIGPLLGGGLHSNWMWIFFINVPSGFIGTVIGIVVLEGVKNPNAPPKGQFSFNFDFPPPPPSAP